MQTAGEWTVNDSHCHFFSHNFLRIVAGQKFGDTAAVDRALQILEWEAPAEEPAVLAQRWIDELDRHGVNRAAMIASAPGDEKSVSAAVRAFPRRLVGFFLLDPTSADAAERAQRALQQLGLRCVCFYPAMHGYRMQDARIDAVLRVAADTPGCAVFVHCGQLTVGFRRKLGLPCPFDLSYGNPLNIAGAAARYPRLPFIIPHMGSGMLREALMVADVYSNIYLDTSSSNSWLRYLGLSLDAALRRCLDVVGPERMLFGTDSSFFPRGWQKHIFEQQLASFRQELQPEKLAKVLGGNFERLFPLPSGNH